MNIALLKKQFVKLSILLPALNFYLLICRDTSLDLHWGRGENPWKNGERLGKAFTSTGEEGRFSPFFHLERWELKRAWNTAEQTSWEQKLGYNHAAADGPCDLELFNQAEAWIKWGAGPQPSSTGRSKPNPARSIRYNPPCSLRNVDLALFWEKGRPRLIIESWRKLGPSEKGLSQTQTLGTTIIKTHQNHFTNQHFQPRWVRTWREPL